jgi:hypothetical protein
MMKRLFRFGALLFSVSLTACATYESYPAYTNGYPYGYYSSYPYYSGPWLGVGIYGSHFSGGGGHGHGHGHAGMPHGGVGTGANSRMGGPGGSGTVLKR